MNIKLQRYELILNHILKFHWKFDYFTYAYRCLSMTFSVLYVHQHKKQNKKWFDKYFVADLLCPFFSMLLLVLIFVFLQCFFSTGTLLTTKQWHSTKAKMKRCYARAHIKHNPTTKPLNLTCCESLFVNHVFL